MGQGLIISVCLPVSEFAGKNWILCRLFRIKLVLANYRWFRIKFVLSNEVTYSLWTLARAVMSRSRVPIFPLLASCDPSCLAFVAQLSWTLV